MDIEREEPAAARVAAVLFDVGGVLMSSPFEAFAAYERDNGLPDGLLRRINSTDPDSNAWARYERREVDEDAFVGLFEAEATALGHRVDARLVLQGLRGHLRPEMVHAVRALPAAGVRLAMVTNNVAPLERPGPLDEVIDCFDAVVQSSVEGVRKPEPAFYRLALDRLGSPAPEEVVFLDDLGVNLKPARALGMTTVKVDDPVAALRELSTLVGLDLLAPAPPGAP